MGIFRSKSSDSTGGLQVQVNHKLIDKDQARVFTEMVKDTVKIIVIGSVVALAAGFAMKLGMDYATQELIDNP